MPIAISAIYTICISVKMLLLAVFVFIFYIKFAISGFSNGRIPMNSLIELERFHGYMTVKEGIFKCETSLECGAFTYHGPKWDLNNTYNIYFFKLQRIRNKNIDDFDWTSYVVSGKKYVKLKNLHFPSSNEYSAVENPNGLCLKIPRCIGYSLSKDGSKLKLHLEEILVFDTKVEDANWNSYILISKSKNISFRKTKKTISENEEISCCNSPNTDDDTNRIINPIPRQNCNLTQEEFEANFIRTKTPVILENCAGFEHWKNPGFNIKQLVQMYYDNTTFSSTTKMFLPLGFTHKETPNDYQRNNDLVLQAFASGSLRSFELLRNNSKSDVFANFQKPSLIPKDLYHATGYENHYNWVIMSQANTGSQLHGDPDLTGAWNYLIHGYKHWVIFPPWVTHEKYGCSKKCKSKFKHLTTKFWFKNVLPQLRLKKFYGKQLWEGVQGPNEVIFLPSKVPHTILNLQDNVAITENYLFVDGLKELAKHLAMDILAVFRSNWAEVAWKRLYFSHLLKAKDRRLMKAMYEHVIESLDYETCMKAEKMAVERWVKRHVQNPDKFGKQNGQNKPPDLALQRHHHNF